MRFNVSDKKLGWILSMSLMFALFCCAVPASAQQAANCEPSDLLLVLDHSGSMASNNKWNDAVKAINTLLSKFGSKLQLGLIAFESSSRLYVSVGRNTTSAIRSALSRLRPRGRTAMKCALQDAYRHFQTYVIPRDTIKDRRRFVVLITDGMPNACGTDVVPAVAALRRVSVAGKSYDVKTFVIGFGSGVNKKQLQNMAVAGGTGQYYQANNLASLQKALDQIGKGASKEICDNKDNDCNGTVDDFSESCRGACGSGTRVCKSGKWSQCSGSRQPQPETCNNIDDNCNGKIDDGLRRNCSNNCGQGTEICKAGKWTGCSAPKADQEVCNGQDDNCNGQVDEGLSRPCTTKCGRGTQACIQSDWSTCSAPSPSPEICNGRDDNCNGQVDEGQLADCNGSCIKGSCLPKCRNGECLGGKICQQGVCIDKPCKVPCAAGQTCRSGQCVTANCNKPGGQCQNRQICRNSRCTPDPCRGVKCAANQYCKNGLCRHSCEKVSCSATQECRNGVCVNKPCAGKCQSGQSCIGGKCVGNSCGPCGANQTCQGTRCVDKPCHNITCPTNQKCFRGECYGSNGPTNPGSNNNNNGGPGNNNGGLNNNNGGPSSNNNGPGGNTGPTNNSNGGSGENNSNDSLGRGGKGGCLCTVNGTSDNSFPFSVFLFLALLPLVIRRKDPSQ